MLSGSAHRAIASLPPGLSLRRFEHCGSRALVVGLQRYSSLHTIYLSDLLRTHQPKCVLTPLSPDHPWLIEAGKDSIETAWTAFLRTARGQFLVRPKPQVFEEVLLSREKVAKFHEGAFMNSPDSFEASPHVAYSKVVFTRDRAGLGAPKGKNLKVDAFLTPLLWLHNNREVSNVSVVAGLPELVYRDQIVRQCTVHQLREYFAKYVDVQWNQGGMFSVQQHNPELFLRPKARYFAEMIRLACVCFPDSLAVIDSEVLPLLEEEWKRIPPTLPALDSFYQIPAFPSPTPFVDHVEMHVLLDFMLPVFLAEWFIPYRIYPYSAFDTLGVKEAFYGQALTTWAYFFDQHLSAYKEQWASSAGPAGRKVKKPQAKAAK